MWSGKTREELEIHFGKSTEEITVFLQKPMALRVPILLCHLIAKGAWRAIVLNGVDFWKTGAQEPLHLAFETFGWLSSCRMGGSRSSGPKAEIAAKRRL